MNCLSVVEVVELSVAAADGEDLLFRLEMLADEAEHGRRFCCRLYRLESFEFRMRSSLNFDSNGSHDVDYRCWVVDDNMTFDLSSARSVVHAKEMAIGTLKLQLGIL